MKRLRYIRLVFVETCGLIVQRMNIEGPVVSEITVAQTGQDNILPVVEGIWYVLLCRNKNATREQSTARCFLVERGITYQATKENRSSLRRRRRR